MTTLTSEFRRGEHTTSLIVAFSRVSVLGSKLLVTAFLATIVGLDAVGCYGFVAGAAAVLPVSLGFGFVQFLSRTLVTDGYAAIAGQLKRYWVVTVAIYGLCGAAWWATPEEFRFGLDRYSVGVITTILLLEHLNNDIFLLVANSKRPLAANLQNFARSAAWIAVYIPFAAVDEGFRSFSSMLWFWVSGLLFSFVLGCHMVLEEAGPRQSEVTRSTARYSLSSAWKLYLADASNGAGIYLDRYIIGALLGAKVAGLYVLLSTFGQGIYTLANTSIMQIYRPYLVEAYAKAKQADFARLLAECMRRTLWSACGFAIVCAVAIHFIAPRFEANSLVKHEPLLWSLVLVALIRLWSDLHGYALYAQRRDSAIAATSCVCLALSATLNLALVPFVGIFGSAIAALLAFAITGLARRNLASRESVEAPTQQERM